MKLGTGGLVKAYSGAVQAALDVLTRTERVEYTTLVLTIPYASIAAVRRILPAHEAVVESERYRESAQLCARVPSGNEDALRTALLEATSGQASFELT